MLGESWHTWLPGYNFTTVSEAVMQLDPRWDVYVCGEAYAVQSWTEGAIETADQVLTRFFKLSSFMNKTEKTDPNSMRSSDIAQSIPFWP